VISLDRLLELVVHDRGRWPDLAEGSLLGLRAACGRELLADWEHLWIDRAAFAVDCGSDTSEAMGVSWRGIVGGALIGARVSVTAVLFAYVDETRVSPPGLSHVHWDLVPTSSGLLWRRIGWVTDEHDEYGMFDVLRTLDGYSVSRPDPRTP